MAEKSFIQDAGLSKEERYEAFIPEFRALAEGVEDPVSLLANTSAALHEAFGFFWVGFYLVKDEEQLVLGPFQGSVACYSIRKGRGVCGTAWAEGRTVVVPDVEAFPGHIACSSLSRSEIVVPVWRKDGEMFGVLDIDSDELGSFDETDKAALEKITGIISRNLV